MAKFGELIKHSFPVLFGFSNDTYIDNANFDKIMVEVAHNFTNKAKVIKIDPHKNSKLCNALDIQSFPAMVIYNNGEMMYKTTSNLKEQTINNQLNILL